MYNPSSRHVFRTHGAVPALLRDRNAAHAALTSVQTRQKWLVPIDGTHVSMAAVDYVVAHADSARIGVHLVNVQPTIMTGSVSALASAELVADLRHSAGEYALRHARTILERHAFRHTSAVVLGETADSIVGYAAEHGCTKIVMAARRSDGIANVIRRSVSRRVVRLAHVPVTIVKAESEQPAPRAQLSRA